CEGVVELFGDEPLRLPRERDWSVDLRSGYGWPAVYYRRLDFRNPGRPSDVKVAWELSRLRHLVALAQGAAVLGDARAPDLLARALSGWITATPAGFSVNWTSAMEVALRAVNLISADAVLEASGAPSPARGLLVASLYQHGWFLERNLEISDLNGNHFLANAVGLVWLRRYFGGVGQASRWLAIGLAMLREAAGKHVLADGLDQEGSLRYHVLVLEMFLAARVAAGEALATVDPVIRHMLDATIAISDRDGRVANLGDDDGGRVLAFCDA